MSELNIQNKKGQKAAKVQPYQGMATPTYVNSHVTPTIVNNNGYIPTYNPAYYTGKYGYQTPYSCMSYPQAQKATLQAGGTTYEVTPGSGGVNIILNNPTVAAPGSHPMINTNTNFPPNGNGNAGASATASANADTQTKPKKTKNIVAITDDYVKNLENYLRSPNKAQKMTAVKQLAQRFEEDESRRTNPSLNALLNLALQAKEKQIRFVALTLLNSGLAGGNDTTIKILNNMQQSTAYNGDEANDVKKALLKMSETVVKVPDNSPDKPKKRTKEDEE